VLQTLLLILEQVQEYEMNREILWFLLQLSDPTSAKQEAQRVRPLVQQILCGLLGLLPTVTRTFIHQIS